jgi:hypothetical protein
MFFKVAPDQLALGCREIRIFIKGAVERFTRFFTF